jgi:hypothetical protein
MKKIFMALFFLILFAGCAGGEVSSREILREHSDAFTYVQIAAMDENENAATNEAELTDETGAESYDEYSVRILYGLGQFRNLISHDIYLNPEPALVIESRSVFGLHTEGGILTRFMTHDGEIVRYTFEIFGETGRAVHNHYFFDDGLIYVQQLQTDYADWRFSTQNRFDTLQYTLTSYVIDGENTFIIDDNFRQIKSAGNENIYSADMLSYFFYNNYIEY